MAGRGNLVDYQHVMRLLRFARNDNAGVMQSSPEYLGVLSVTLRRWIKTGKISAYKIGRAYTFEVMDLKRLKKNHLTKESATDLPTETQSER